MCCIVPCCCPPMDDASAVNPVAKRWNHANNAACWLVSALVLSLFVVSAACGYPGEPLNGGQIASTVILGVATLTVLAIGLLHCKEAWNLRNQAQQARNAEPLR